jgi:predicted NAD/FAD-binding protein
MRIAIVGSGISGLGATWALQRVHDVTLFEAAGRPGGHANTVTATVDGVAVDVDTGFIVYNEANYPNFVRLLAALDVATEASDMSFGVSIGDGGIEYAGSRRGLLAQPSNLLRPGYWRMLRDVARFFRTAEALLAEPDAERLSLRDWLARESYSREFADDHLLPMGAAIWSAPVDRMLDFPAAGFVRFFRNHALLEFAGRPPWRTVSGGSRRYVDRIAAALGARLRLDTSVRAVRRHSGGVDVETAVGTVARFDAVVLATHADHALSLLGEGAGATERSVLGAFGYETNLAVLHRDRRLMPRRRAVWSSWNYLADRDEDGGRSVCVSYWLNRLQNLDTPDDLFVTLNPIREIDPALELARFTYDHPQFDLAAVSAQARLPEIQGNGGVWYCGSYCGNGFHEDGLQAGLQVAAALGAPAPWAHEIVPVSPAQHAVSPLLAKAAE